MPFRLVLSALALLLAGPGALAQPDAAPVKYWVFFADKLAGDGWGEDRAMAPAVVTPRALERRRLRSSPARPSRLDLPVAAPSVERLRAIGIEPVVTSRWFNAVSARLTAEQADAVRALSFVRDVRPVGRLAPRRAAPASPVVIDYGPSQLQLDVINARAAIEAGYDGSGVVVGFLDTTFDFGHPAFATTEVLGQEDFTGQPQGSTHGLAVASVAVGFDEGALVGPGFGAAVLAATTEYAPTETHQEEDFFVAGMEWLEAGGADVVNVSLGYSTFDAGEGDYTYDDMDGNTTLVTQAADIAASLGLVVVTSAGNEGDDDWFYVTAPADADSVIAVGAIRADSTRSPFSSHGPTADGRTKPDVVALGSGVVIARADGGYGSGSGTSFSAPAVSGVVAQILQANPALDPIAVRDVLRATASQADGPDNDLGWGVVDAATAVQQALALAADGPAPAPETAAEAFLYPTVVLRDRRALTMELRGIGGAGPVALRLYDVLGRRVAVLYDGPLRLGPVALALPRLPAGVYFYRFTGGVEEGGRIVVQ
jgi:subtilisin family serine protease